VNSILNRRDFIKAIGAGAVSLATLGFVPGSRIATSKNNKQPNIILIMSDNVSPDLYGCYGNKKVRTPNIDEMARDGVMFRMCWASALCAPTRALIMTGLPDGYQIDGKSLKSFLTGRTDTHRDWIYSIIGTTQLVRTKRYLLESVNSLLGMPEGRLYDCGNNHDGWGYRKITDPLEAVKVRNLFDEILRKYPVPNKDNPFFKTIRGKRFLGEYTQPVAVEKHLHNHRKYKFYEE